MGAAGFVAITAAAALLIETRDSGRERARLDEIAALLRENTAAVRAAGAAADAALQEGARRVAALEAALGAQRRGAIALNLEVETPCGGDVDCQGTARAVCARIGYPNGLSSRFTPGARPVLHSLVCFD